MSMMEYYETADQLRRAEQAKQDEANAAEFIRERVDPRERLRSMWSLCTSRQPRS